MPVFVVFYVKLPNTLYQTLMKHPKVKVCKKQCRKMFSMEMLNWFLETLKWPSHHAVGLTVTFPLCQRAQDSSIAAHVSPYTNCLLYVNFRAGEWDQTHRVDPTYRVHRSGCSDVLLWVAASRAFSHHAFTSPHLKALLYWTVILSGSIGLAAWLFLLN